MGHHNNQKHFLEGKRFGALLVLRREDITPKGGKLSWVCLCDCGNTVLKQTNNLVRGVISTCGSVECLRKSRARCSGAGSYAWKGCGDLNGALWSHIISGAKSRDLPFTLTIQDGWALYEQQEGKCALTGVPIKFIRKRKKSVGNVTNRASLDRIDSKLGYVKGNVQWVLADINIMKYSHTTEYFLYLCNLVVAHNSDTLKAMTNNYLLPHVQQNSPRDLEAVIARRRQDMAAFVVTRAHPRGPKPKERF